LHLAGFSLGFMEVPLIGLDWTVFISLFFLCVWWVGQWGWILVILMTHESVHYDPCRIKATLSLSVETIGGLQMCSE
jgi:hypothetical protein